MRIQSSKLRYRPVRGAAVVLLLAVAARCGGEDPQPPLAPTPQPLTPAASINFVTISGNLSLTAIGETSQLSVTATHSDGTTSDVTSRMTFGTSGREIVSISPSGLLTVLKFGADEVWTRSQGGGRLLIRVQHVTATPPGTFAFFGVVSEPTANDFLESFGGLPGVRVTETRSGRSVITDSAGKFSLAELPSTSAHLRLEKEGYEPVETEQGDIAGSRLELPIQPIIRLVAGETVTPVPLAVIDLSHEVGSQRCIQCRLVRVTVPRAGTVRVRVVWTEPAELSLFADGRLLASGTSGLSADVRVDAPREVLMYFGGTRERSVRGRVPFTFETSLD
jgi:hypothetical protein